MTPATRETYTLALETFCGFAGGLAISDVARLDVLNFVKWLESRRRKNGQQYSTASLRTWMRPVRQMLRDAVADGLLDRDPTHRVDPPAGGSVVRELRTLSLSEVGSLVAASMYTNYWHRYPEIATLAYTGMRPGEMFALRWCDVDWTGERLRIAQAVSGGVIMSTTKTKAGRETYLPAVVAAALRWQRVELARLGRLNDLVFPARNGGARLNTSLVKPLAAARDLAGIQQRVGPQVLRRTFNTLLLNAGVNEIVIRSMLGHSSEEMTELYSGVRHEAKTAAVLQLIQGSG